ncbi:MAG: MFS transporter [Anaerolineae bacterium]|nr:MAG: MFS transporter [Anaerolineae bacterium]
MSEHSNVGFREASFLRDKAYVANSLSHFFIDTLNSSRSLLIALLAVSLGLSNTQVGLALLLYNVGSALSQPFFGVGADRYGPRWFILGGLIWTSTLYALATIVGDWLALLFITLAGLGSGAFHPSGTKIASEASFKARIQATAFFFSSGQIGLFAGPILAGLLIEDFGRSGFLLMPILSLVAIISGSFWISNNPSSVAVSAIKSTAATAAATAKRSIPWRTIGPLLLLILSISTVGIATINFAPKLFTELGYAPAYVGVTAGIYMLGSAVGGLVGGTLADRVGRRPAILIGVLGAIIPLYLYIPAPDPWRFFLLLFAGFFGGMPQSVLVIIAQGLLPGRRAFASGLTLGLMFFSGAVGSLILGVVADQAGLAEALQGLVILLITAAVAAVFLPKGYI